MKDREESTIVENARQGDVNAFSVLVTQHQEIVFSIALRMVRNREDAEEIAQETFIRAFRSIQSFERKCRFSTWLYKIAYNTCISAIRKKKFTGSKVDPGMIAERELVLQDGEDEDTTRLENLEKVLRSLPEEDYLIVLLYYYEDQNIAEISQVTGLGQSNVKVKLHRIRKKIYLGMQEMMNEHCLV